MMALAQARKTSESATTSMNDYELINFERIDDDVPPLNIEQISYSITHPAANSSALVEAGGGGTSTGHDTSVFHG